MVELTGSPHGVGCVTVGRMLHAKRAVPARGVGGCVTGSWAGRVACSALIGQGSEGSYHESCMPLHTCHALCQALLAILPRANQLDMTGHKCYQQVITCCHLLWQKLQYAGEKGEQPFIIIQAYIPYFLLFIGQPKACGPHPSKWSTKSNARGSLLVMLSSTWPRNAV